MRKGVITCASVGRLVAHLIHMGESGVIRFSGERRKMTTIVKGGDLLEVQSNYIREDTLGRYLIAEKIITKEENEASLKKAREMQLPQGQALVGMHILNQSELLGHVTEHKMRKFLRLFQGAWDNCHYEFFPQQVAVRKSLMEPIALTKVLKLGVLKVARIETLYQSIEKRNLFTHPICLAPDFDQVAYLLRLKPKTAEMARWLANKSLQEVRNSEPEVFDRALRLTFLLIVAQAARFDTQPQTTVSALDEKKEAKPSAPANLDLEQALSDARNFFNDRDYRIAKSFLERALKIDEKNVDALAMLAWSDFELKGKRNAKASAGCIDMLKRAVRIDPEHEMAHLYLGRIYKHQNRPDLAAPHFVRANKINPDNDEAQREVRLIQIQKRKQDQFKYRE